MLCDNRKKEEERTEQFILWSAEVWQMGGLTGRMMDEGSKFYSLILLKSVEQWMQKCASMDGKRMDAEVKGRGNVH